MAFMLNLRTERSELRAAIFEFEHYMYFNLSKRLTHPLSSPVTRLF